MTALRCPVRACGEPLAREPARLICPRRHAFDIARSGYVNLLQPDERRSSSPGDSAASVQARRRALAAGVHDALAEVMATIVRAESAAHGGEALDLLDVGCGDGSLLRHLARVIALRPQGLDLSSAAADVAARAMPDALVVVANADRRLPQADASLDVVISANARVNPEEFHRVLRPAGLLIVAVPGPEDQRELRERVLGSADERDRLSPVTSELASRFDACATVEARQRRRFEPDILRDLLAATYRGARRSQAAPVAALSALDLTSHHLVATFRTRRGDARRAGG
jgi:23S rRNA (guanine745-N1)-methyltransferase